MATISGPAQQEAEHDAAQRRATTASPPMAGLCFPSGLSPGTETLFLRPQPKEVSGV